MSDTFRAPKLVREEAVNGDQLSQLVRDGQPMTLAQVVEMRSVWRGAQGLQWANRIVADVRTRVAEITERDSMTDETRDVTDVVETAEAVEPVAPVLGVDHDLIPDSIMAADAALDAAQSLLEAVENSDPVVSQAYYLLKAADAALGVAIDALGMTDVDDEISENEPAGEPVDETVRSGELLAETRKSAIATAERITMSTEVRAVASDDGKLRIAGYAATFNSEATGLAFREMIAPGAFTRTLKSGEPVFLLVNHDTDFLPLASTQSGTMQLREDANGLYMEAELDPRNPRAQELASALERGDVDKMSFAFTVAPDGESRSDGLRTLTDLNLFEVSVVTWPAYDSTSVGKRDAGDQHDALELRRRALLLRLRLDALS